MKSKPVKRTPAPAYPTRGELLADQDLLRAHLPRRWRLGTDVVGAAAVILATNLTGCGADLAADPPPPAAAAATADKPGTAAPRAKSRSATVVAPIFDHGKGRGATGCVVVSPPVFLSEEEAIQIVKEELAKHGIQLKANVPLKNVEIRPRFRQRVKGAKKSRVVEDRSRAKRLTVDGMDAAKKVAVEFISQREYDSLGGVGDGEQLVDKNGRLLGMSMSTVQTYDFKAAALYLAKQINQQAKQKLYAGVFYDPMVKHDFKKLSDEERKDPGMTWEKRRQNAAAEAQKLLRLQARDFVAWLKKQKAI